MDRRSVLMRFACAALFTGGILNQGLAFADETAKAEYRLATFKADVTPAIGSPLCGGWIRPAEVIDDPLEARGIVLLGGDKPIVLCALDWVENNNSSYDAWREALAEAAGTDVGHVAVQCVHPHNAPWADFDAERLAQEVDPTLHLFDPISCRKAIQDTAAALKESLSSAKPITHVGYGQGEVEKVASSRRILDDSGKVAIVRMSRTKNPAAKAAPEGVIDPILKTLSFWNKDQPVAALHYYATHPMSYYGDGRVSSDFCGLAREKRQQEQPDVFQVYFNGCAGNVTAGKYNNATQESRIALRDRVHAGMVKAWEDTKREPIDVLQWSVEPVKFSARSEKAFSPEVLHATLANKKVKVVQRMKAAIVLAWLARIDRPIDISTLRIGKTAIIHLPGEPFVEYQLFAQKERPDDFVCVAGYGDGGIGYIPLEHSFVEGGYEPTMAFASPDSEPVIKDAIRKLLSTK
jgi:hypothetical protein